MMGVLVCLAAALPGTVDVTVGLEPPEIPFHRTAQMTISIEAPSDMPLEWPDISHIARGLSVAGPIRTVQNEQTNNGRTRITRAYELDAIWTGDYPLGPITVRYGNDASVSVVAPMLRVRDLTAEEEAAALRFAPHAGPILPRYPFLETWWFRIAGAAAIAAALWGLFHWWRKRPRVPKPVRPRPAWEIAYDRIRELDAKQLPERGAYGPYYVELSSIVRHYIEDRFSLRAPEQTTQEFLYVAAQSGLLNPDHQKLLARFLRHSDRVKFARYQPTVNEMEHSMADVLRFIDETIPAQQPKEAVA